MSPNEKSKLSNSDSRSGQGTSSGFPDAPDDDDPPPPYGEEHGVIENEEAGYRATIADDGRVNVRINQKTKGLSTLLVPALRSQLDLIAQGREKPPVPSLLAGEAGEPPPPPLNVVIHVVGSRGDVQPFIALGKVLKEQYGHRVRLATHPVFTDFVNENGLEFFNIGGDPSELMAFMVKNPGLMPGFDTMRRGDIGNRRKEIGNMIKGCWRSCIETGDGNGPEASDKTVEAWANADGGADTAKPFVADCIIANPPSFAHIHCAEKLGIPLHMMFTMPWSPTQSFPHPLANITSTNAEVNVTNYLSYALVDMMTWQGLGDVINRFRSDSLGLEPVSLTWAPGMLSRLRIPYTYCWSPALIPKPRDWGHYISISGFYFLSLGSSFTPEPDLAAFLEAGPPPVYIGFGSIVVDDPNAMTKLIFDAVKKSGQRALVSKGWGGFGADKIGIPEGVFMLGNVPHDWLFTRVSCVVHHGGAGTTAAGIACGKPTVIVPFFGDQPFWGAMVAKAGAGPKPVPYKSLTAEILAASIAEALKPATVQKAKELSQSISHEKGTEEGAKSFHRELEIDKMRCVLTPKRAAVWRLKRTEIRLSAFAATVLGNEGLVKFSDLKLYRPREHFVEDEPFDPITGGASALIGTMGSMAMGVADLPIQTLKALKIHPDAVKSSKAKSSEAPAASSSSKGKQPQHLSANGTPSQSRSRSRSSSHSSTSDNEGAAVAAEIGNEMASAAAVSEDAEKAKKKTSTHYDAESALKTSATASSSGSKSPLHKAAAANNFDLESALDTGRGLFRFAGAGIKSPMDFTLNLARGFHNAPKLYGDETVRPSEKITDFQSGIRVAGKEFGYGFFDGISGLVTQPMEGAKKEGAAGFIKGFAKGIGGVVLKPGAAIWGIPGYTSKGIYKEMLKRFGPSVENYIIASRTAQGYADVGSSTREEREAVVRQWKEMRQYIRKKKTFKEESKEGLQAKQEALKKKHEEVWGKRDAKVDLERTETLESMDVGSPGEGDDGLDIDPLAHLDVGREGEKQEAREMEEAIRRSVAETSKGDKEQDAEVERAIRASVADLAVNKAGAVGDKDFDRAMQTSVKEVRAGLAPGGRVGDDADEEMSRAMRESEEQHAQRLADLDEEEVVMRYIMKQSLAEEEARKKKQGGSG